MQVAAAAESNLVGVLLGLADLAVEVQAGLLQTV
jgi:hypothetical protein